MDFIISFFDQVSGLGSSVMVPIFIITIGLVFGLGFLKSIRAGVMVGVGFVGLNLVLGIVWNYVGPVTSIFIDKFDLQLSVIDAGWAAAAGVAFATKVGAVIIPFIVALNMLLLLLKQTKTVNIDIWNYWHYAFTGAIVSVGTGSFGYGLLAAAAHAIISLKLADLTAERVQEEMGIPGISIPQGYAVSTIPVYMLLDKVYDRIPFLRKRTFDTELITSKLGVMGEPLMIGLLLGILFGALAGYSIGKILELGIVMAALMLLLPRMVKVIMEGLVPISNAARDFLKRKFNGSDFYIGLDSAVLVGHPNTVTIGILLIPITLFLAMIVPMNKTVPFADLAATAFFISMATPIHKGDFVRTLLSGTIMMSIVLVVASYFAPAITNIAIETGFVFPEGATQITAMSAGNLVAAAISMLANLGALGIGLIVVGVTAMIILMRNKKSEKQVTE